VTGRKPGDLSHSVQERLKNRARAEGRLCEELLVRHGLERLIVVHEAEVEVGVTSTHFHD
jgi:hypothetical protein